MCRQGNHPWRSHWIIPQQALITLPCMIYALSWWETGYQRSFQRNIVNKLKHAPGANKRNFWSIIPTQSQLTNQHLYYRLMHSKTIGLIRETVRITPNLHFRFWHMRRVEGDTIDYFVGTTMATSYPSMLLSYLMIAPTPYADLMIDLSTTMATSYASSMIALTPYGIWSF